MSGIYFKMLQKIKLVYLGRKKKIKKKNTSIQLNTNYMSIFQTYQKLD